MEQELQLEMRKSIYNRICQDTNKEAQDQD